MCLKEFRLFLNDFGMLSSLNPQINNKEIILSNELWKSLARYDSQSADQIKKKYLKSMLKAVFGLVET